MSEMAQAKAFGWGRWSKVAPLLTNSAWNIVAILIPTLFTVPAMGIMARKLGLELFGLFTLAFAIFGYAGIFDVGLTRAVIRSVALHRDDERKVRLVVGTASCVVLMLGVIAAAIVWTAAGPLARVLNVTPTKIAELIRSFHWISAGIPCLLLTLIWLSYFEGKEQFAELSVLKSITNSLLAILPVLALVVQNSLESAIVALVAARAIGACIVYLKYRNSDRKVWCFDWEYLIELWRFGGWITVSNIVSPIMVYFDRFILSHISGAQVVAFYTAPSEAIARISVVPGAVARSLFPRLNNKATNADMQAKLAFWTLMVASIAIGVPIFAFSRLILTTWMGPEFGGTASTVLRVLIVGFVFNALALVPFAKIQARGDSRITAFIHLAELIPYIALLLILVRAFSYTGAAAAWTIRMAVDLIVLQVMSER